MMLIIRQSDSFIKTEHCGHCGISKVEILENVFFFKSHLRTRLQTAQKPNTSLLFFFLLRPTVATRQFQTTKRSPSLCRLKRQLWKIKRQHFFFLLHKSNRDFSVSGSSEILHTDDTLTSVRLHWVSIFSQVEMTRSKNWEGTVIESSPVTEVVELFIVLTF